MLAGALIAGVAVANATVFSASGFARDYLTTLADGRVDEVLALPGVATHGLDERMLDPLALQPFRWQVTGESTEGDEQHVAVSFAGADTEAHATLYVERIGTRFGLFPEWGFSRSPITALSVTASGDTRFTVGALPLEVADADPVRFAALTPGFYSFTHESPYLTSEEVVVAATGGAASVDVHVTPNAAFIAAAQQALAAKLGECTAQAVLFPTGCPFGFAITNRVASDPQWSIDPLPEPELVTGKEIGSWAFREVTGVAVLRVEVQSLFDGSVSSLEQEVPFSTAYRVGFDGVVLVLASADPADFDDTDGDTDER